MDYSLNTSKMHEFEIKYLITIRYIQCAIISFKIDGTHTNIMFIQ